MYLKSLADFKGVPKVRASIERRLAKTRFEVWHEVPLHRVMAKEPMEGLPDDLAAYLKRARFDSLVLHRKRPKLPILAVEFDEPHHETDRKTGQRDVKKNHLCRISGLPLLRVRDAEIEPQFRRDDFLLYLLEVVLRYKHADEKKKYTGAQSAEQLTDRDYDEIQRHDLPKIRWLRSQLARKHGIVALDEIAEMRNPKLAFAFHLGASDYASSDTTETHEGHLILYRVDRSLGAREWPAAGRITKVLSLLTRYRATEGPRPPWPKHSLDVPAMEAYANWVETEPWYFPEIPGVNWQYVAWNILEALCLTQLLARAEVSSKSSTEGQA